MKNVGRQRVDVDDLTPQDLDQLSRLIVDALQVVDRDQGPNRGPPRVGPGPRDLGGGLRDREKEEELLDKAPLLKPQESTRAAPADLQGNFTVIHSFVFTQLR